MERLVELARVTAVDIGELRTLRWTPKDFWLDAMLMELSRALDETSYDGQEWNAGLTEIRSCVGELRASRSDADVDWDEVCGLGERRAVVLEACDRGDEEACSLQSRIAAVDHLVSTVEMRVSLGVTEDERLLREGRFESCAGDRR